MSKRTFTKYPSGYVKASSTNKEDIKNYVKQLISEGDDLQLIFNIGGRFPSLTIHEFTGIVNDLYNEGIKIPGVMY